MVEADLPVLARLVTAPISTRGLPLLTHLHKGHFLFGKYFNEMVETQAMWVGLEQPSISHKDSGFETSVPLVGHSRAADTCEAGWEVWLLPAQQRERGSGVGAADGYFQSAHWAFPSALHSPGLAHRLQPLQQAQGLARRTVRWCLGLRGLRGPQGGTPCGCCSSLLLRASGCLRTTRSTA